MKTTTYVSAALSALVLAGPLGAQDVPPGDPTLPDGVAQSEALEDLPAPPGMAALETDRSRRCVAGLDRLGELSARMEPIQRREARLEALFQAVALEDSLRVAPFADSPLEAEVREWFVRDDGWAREYLESEDEDVQARRREAREQLFERLREAHRGVVREAEEAIGGEDDVGRIIRDCESAVLVRPAVLEACGTSESLLCQAARAEESSGGFLFVDDADDLWDIEQLRPWAEPSALRPSPDGTLLGARTGAMSRRGNVALLVTVEPLIQARSAISDEEADRFEANLEALGIDFHHPGYVMAPAMRFEVDVPGPLGGETHYLLHFGDLSNPEADIISVIPAGAEGPVGAFFPLEEVTLVRLAQGEEVILTAVLIPDEEAPVAEALFSIGITSVGQSPALTSLLRYMAEGQLGADLASFFPVDDPDGP